MQVTQDGLNLMLQEKQPNNKQISLVNAYHLLSYDDSIVTTKNMIA